MWRGCLIPAAHHLDLVDLNPDGIELWLGDGSGSFVASSAEFGLDGSGAITGTLFDFDAEGDLDLAINNSDGPAEVYENLTGTVEGNWILIDLVQTSTNRFAIGARAEIPRADGVQLRELRTASSYQSQNALTLHLGVGTSTRVETLSIRWPVQGEQRFHRLP